MPDSPSSSKSVPTVAVLGVAVLVLVIAGVVTFGASDSTLAPVARIVFSVGLAGLALLGINTLVAGMATRSYARFGESMTALEQAASAHGPAAVADGARSARQALDAGDVEAARKRVEQIPTDAAAGPVAPALAECRRTGKKAGRLYRRQQRVAR
ncbi:hypothetical protein GCM10011519_33440 [Marmoricola endophyticus]|uniref:Uncharacterized protein n=1 Tax=Marmoricola endophyticus TaxID=2040280 RepID=A0A917F6Z2_9ACTN|nr:hypothetical protein [Marmoricola endophyticus]GGF56842.1 hypothetical protein GCM10011519_33440 [Marmoricola endophyticus]